MARYWFKPQRYGYGATPSTWQGWLSTGLFSAMLVIVILNVGHVMRLAQTGALATPVVLGIFALFIATIVSFIRFAAYKTDSEWRWRWG